MSGSQECYKSRAELGLLFINSNLQDFEAREPAKREPVHAKLRSFWRKRAQETAKGPKAPERGVPPMPVAR